MHTCATQPLMAYDLPEVLESTSWMVPVNPLYLRQDPACQTICSEVCTPTAPHMLPVCCVICDTDVPGLHRLQRLSCQVALEVGDHVARVVVRDGGAPPGADALRAVDQYHRQDRHVPTAGGHHRVLHCKMYL